MDITGASAIVTGGASGLGAAAARRVAGAGAFVVVLDRDEQLGQLVAAEIGGTFVRADVTNEDDVAGAVRAASNGGPLRVLVNCAGIGTPGRTIDRFGKPLEMASFEHVVRVNLLGTFNCIRLAAAAMSRTEELPGSERGAIVNTASVAAFDGQVGQAAYAASKAGVVGMTLAIARDLAVIGVRVNTVAPGLFDTPIYGTDEKADLMKKTLQRDLLFPKRFGLSSEFASIALELITNSYMNGETLRIDGGMRLSAK